MPIGEIEVHPYLNLGLNDDATKLILGSFPVYECTDEDNDRKQQNRIKEGTVRFFYGSNRNSLWTLYSRYIDNSIIKPWDPILILSSLKKNRIALSDTIKSCERYKYKTVKKTGERILDQFSSEDDALKKKTWNKEIIQNLINSGVTKILCTSKGVLDNLEHKIISPKRNPFGVIDKVTSQTFQNDFIKKLDGNIDTIKKPISKVFKIGDYQVSALAIPSPGSPQRRLRDFGFDGDDWRIYADSYFENAFIWLNN